MLMQLNNIISSYKKNCRKLLYTDPITIKNTTEHLKRLMANIYGYPGQDKESLLANNTWTVRKTNTFKAKTSGTTTGRQFHYLIDNDHYNFVEFQCRYKQIINEFGINCKNIFFLLSTNNINVDQKITTNKKPRIASHGTTGTQTHYYKWSNNIIETANGVISYLENNKIDVVLTDGSIINILKHVIESKNIKTKLCKLISNINEQVTTEDVNFLLKNGNTDFWCDHMRCWDGGASFMTCPYYTYHLLENLAYMEEKDSKLISTDYFNHANPFIEYWNGDYCSIDSSYKLCKCKRWYREFTMSKTRTWSANGMTSEEIKQKIQSLKIPNIQQVRSNNKELTIISKQIISEENKLKLSEALPNFKIIYNDKES